MLLNLLIRKLVECTPSEYQRALVRKSIRHRADQDCFELNFEEARVRVCIKFQRHKTPTLSRSLSFLEIVELHGGRGCDCTEILSEEWVDDRRDGYLEDLVELEILMDWATHKLMNI
uniref:Uncharacterized protein n=1 Tax=Glossina pallidipes TaxID=7398 RepID=A0A1A9ZA03_GLOPL